MKPALIKLSHIDFNDKTFLFSYPVIDSGIDYNIKEFGFILPPVLKRVGQFYHIVTGYKRLLGAQKNSILDVYAFITDLSEYNAFRFAIHENINHRRLNIFEISGILHKLLSYFKISKRDIINDYLPLLGYNPHEKVLNQLLRPNTLNSAQRDKVFSAHIDAEKIFVLGTLPKDVLDIGIAILTDMRPGLNKFKQLIELAREIIQSEGITLHSLFTEQPIRDIFLDPTRTSTQKFTQLHRILYTRRNPVITMVEEEYKRKYTQLNLDRHIKLTHPRGFEGSEFKVEVTFNNKEELQKYSTDLLNLSENPVFDELLNFL